jgi:hypothetical protein
MNMKQLFSWRKAGKGKPIHQRLDVRLEASLILLPREISVNGLILNVSEGGCLFRPFLSHLISRTGDKVLVEVGGGRIFGHVMNTNERGYGVAFEELVDLSMFLALDAPTGDLSSINASSGLRTPDR